MHCVLCEPPRDVGLSFVNVPLVISHTLGMGSTILSIVRKKNSAKIEISTNMYSWGGVKVICIVEI